MRGIHWLQSPKVRKALEESTEHLKTVTEKADKLDPQITRLEDNVLTQNHVVANMFASWGIKRGTA